MTGRLAALAGATFLVAGALPATAIADGLPVLGIDVGSKGVTARLAPVRYVTLPSGRDTIVARTGTAGGRVLRYNEIRGTFTIPAVAYDGSADGLSADGRTLVLIEPRVAFPRERTTLAVVDARRLRVVRRITLPGDFSFDAISPHARTLFLIQYISPQDPTRYHVRAYDLSTGTLSPKLVVDPREHEDAMRGSPLTRAASPGGRFAFTLYDGAGRTPFVHALDTRTRQARCIDLPMLAGLRNLWQVRLSVGGSKVTVAAPGRTLAFIDRSDFGVATPGPTSNTVLLAAEVAGAGAIAALLAVAAWFGLRRLRRRPGAGATDPRPVA
jgi:hypothetical protein